MEEINNTVYLIKQYIKNSSTREDFTKALQLNITSIKLIKKQIKNHRRFNGLLFNEKKKIETQLNKLKYYQILIKKKIQSFVGGSLSRHVKTQNNAKKKISKLEWIEVSKY
jgi:hypothetical protein